MSMLLDDDEISVVVTDGDNRHRVANPVVVTAADDGGSVPEVTPAATSSEDYAYVIHTSGSTGRPKGVPVTHRSLVNSTLARDHHYGNRVGRFLLLSSFAFDSSVAGIFWTLCTGGALVLPGPDREHDVAHLLTLASQHRVTHLLGLPSLYQLLLEHDEGRHLASLEVAIVEVHFERAPDAQLHNEYGPTETTVWCSAHRATAADRGRPLPIGRPIAGSRIYVMDPFGHRVSPGFAGEIAIAGAGLSPGYLHRPDLTAERFVTLHIDGAAEAQP